MTETHCVTVCPPWYGEHEEAFAKLAREILAPALGMPIELISQKRPESLIDDGIFRIYIWSAPKSAARNIRPPSHVFGRRVCKQSLSFEPQGDGVLLEDKPSGFVPAELFGTKALMVYMDVSHCDCPRDVALMCSIFNWVVTRTHPEYQDQNASDAAQALLEYLEAPLGSALGVLQQERSDIQYRGEKLVSRAETLTGRIEEYRKELEAIDTALADDASLVLEMRNLLRHPRVEHVEVQEEGLVIYTDELRVIDRCQERRKNPVQRILGRYRLFIPFNRGWEFIQAVNLDRFDGSHQGPHLNSYGHICAGNTKHILNNLFWQREYVIIATFMLEFLQLADPGDGWVEENIGFYPIVPSEKESPDEAAA